MRGARLVLAAALLLLVAGCAGKSRTSAESPDAAPPPTVGADTGSIVGLVFDDEQAPIPGVNVSVKDLAATTTDASGVFTLNDMPPGQHALGFGHLDFLGASRKVDVTAGEVTEIRVELQRGNLSGPVHWSFNKVGHLRLGQYTLQYVQNTVNHTAVDAIFCDPCTYGIELRPGIVDAVTDVKFTRAATVPLVNEYVTAVYTTSTTGGAQLKLLMTHDFQPRESYQWSSVQVRELRGYEAARLGFHGPDDSPPGVTVNQRVELWQTFAQGQMLPKGYTLLPP